MPIWWAYDIAALICLLPCCSGYTHFYGSDDDFDWFSGCERHSRHCLRYRFLLQIYFDRLSFARLDTLYEDMPPPTLLFDTSHATLHLPFSDFRHARRPYMHICLLSALHMLLLWYSRSSLPACLTFHLRDRSAPLDFIYYALLPAYSTISFDELLLKLIIGRSAPFQSTFRMLMIYIFLKEGHCCLFTAKAPRHFFMLIRFSFWRPE